MAAVIVLFIIYSNVIGEPELKMFSVVSKT